MTITPADITNLERLLEKATKCTWTWSDRTVDKDGYVYVPQCSHLGHTLISLGDTYENSAEDCDYIAAILNAAPDLIKCARENASLKADVSDKDVLAWAKRHDLQDNLMDLRCMFEDARSFRPALSAGQTGGKDG